MERDDELHVRCDTCDLEMQILPPPPVDGVFLNEEECKELVKFIFESGWISYENFPMVHALKTRLYRFKEE